MALRAQQCYAIWIVGSRVFKFGVYMFILNNTKSTNNTTETVALPNLTFNIGRYIAA
ncbi:hypothetical protein PSEUDO8O_150106 [Pseudomonas sp. 8O]|nr:hypothetical protein PSEUDO8O_150106 [Pseudomonas sp. 8O]